MRIGVDACCWANGRGYGRFTRELVASMVAQAPEEEFLFFVDDRALARLDVSAANAKVVHVRLRESPTEAASADGSRRVSDMLKLTRAVARERPDVFFSPSVYTYFPLPLRQKAVVAIHDVIAEQFPHLTLPTLRARLFWRMKVGLALRQASIILTVSDYSARGVHDFLKVPESRIRVAGEAPSVAYRRSEPEDIARTSLAIGLPPGARWFVYVGGFNPHKRVTSLIRAHARVIQEEGEKAPYLLLVGDLAGDNFYRNTAHVRQVIDELGTGHRTLWTGFLPDETLRDVHSGALALVLPSEAEGFGLPAVEAAACGTPVIATTESPLPILLQGGGIFVAPDDQQTLDGALRLLSRDEPLRLEMGRRALARARALTWDNGAISALEAIREAAA